MWGHCSAHGVGLPNVHLDAASTILASPCIRVTRVSRPVADISLHFLSAELWVWIETPAYLAVDELDILRALCVAVAGSVLRTCLVGRVLSHPTIGVHLHEVESTVKPTREVGHVNVERELLVLKVEHRVRGLVVHQVDSGANVRVCARGDEVQTEGVASARDTVSSLVVSTVQSAVL